MSQEVAAHHHIDLRGTPCPVNFIRCCMTLESLKPNECLHVEIDKGEPEEMVIPGLRNAGHVVEIVSDSPTWLCLKITCGSR